MKRKATSQLLADVPSNIEKYTKETGWIDDYMISKGIEYFSSPTGIIVADVELKKRVALRQMQKMQRLYMKV